IPLPRPFSPSCIRVEDQDSRTVVLSPTKKASFGTPFLLDAFSGETTLSRRLMRNMGKRSINPIFSQV
ncbi:hypothetical protein, partial [Pseudomonas syringae]|uniref:hypothetical protein n=1 Tax=Pseudomonas syringae TaxID=317 RepID=UPI001E530B23